MIPIIALVVAPLVIFLIFVAPVWLILHYRSKKQLSQGLTEQETKELLLLAKTAEKMSQRILTLEKILDSEQSDWRTKYD